MQSSDLSQSNDPINTTMAVTNLAMLLFTQLGNRAVLPFSEAAEVLFHLKQRSAEAKLKQGAYPGLRVLELEADNRKSRPLVSVYDLANYFLTQKEVVVLDKPTTLVKQKAA